MSNPLYTKLAATAQRMLKTKGVQLTLRRSGPNGVYSVAQGGYSQAGTDITGTFLGVVLPYDKEVKELAGGATTGDDRFVADLVEGKFRKVLLAARGAAFTPKGGDTLAGYDGSDWQVMGSSALAPDGATPIIFTLAVRRK